jgi:hypothetical protein
LGHIARYGRINNMKVYAFLLAIVGIAAVASASDETAPDWIMVTDRAGWQPRDSQGEVVYKDHLWIFGGWFDSYSGPPRDVWNSADGKNWNRVVENAAWKLQRWTRLEAFEIQGGLERVEEQ